MLRFRTCTFRNNLDIMLGILDIFEEEITPIFDVAGLLATTTFQPISVNVLEHMAKREGNVLGLSPDEGPLISKAPRIYLRLENDEADHYS